MPATSQPAARSPDRADAAKQAEARPAEPAGRTEAGQPAGGPPAADDATQVSVVPGITRYHKNDCLLIRFLSADDLEVMTRREAADAGCVPCKACKPDPETADLTGG